MSIDPTRDFKQKKLGRAAQDDRAHPERLRQKVYGRRLGRPLRGSRQDAITDILPAYQIDPETLNTLDCSKVHWLEIGFGSGEHLIWQAEQNKDVHLIGCEPFLNGVSYCVQDIREADLTNISIWPDDARIILNHLPDNSIERLFILHPDPWPKKRHHKRRFIQQDTLSDFARVMKKDAILRMASDHSGVAGWMLEQALEHKAFDWLAETADDWRKRPNAWPQTRYEQKGLEAGRKPYYMQFKRL